MRVQVFSLFHKYRSTWVKALGNLTAQPDQGERGTGGEQQAPPQGGLTSRSKRRARTTRELGPACRRMSAVSESSWAQAPKSKVTLLSLDIMFYPYFFFTGTT